MGKPIHPRLNKKITITDDDGAVRVSTVAGGMRITITDDDGVVWSTHELGPISADALYQILLKGHSLFDPDRGDPMETVARIVLDDLMRAAKNRGRLY